MRNWPKGADAAPTGPFYNSNLRSIGEDSRRGSKYNIGKPAQTGATINRWE
jgi:hypothetical protein